MPSAKSSSAGDDSWPKLLQILNSKSEFESNNFMSLLDSCSISLPCPRPLENDIRGLVSEHILVTTVSDSYQHVKDNGTKESDFRSKEWMLRGNKKIKSESRC